MATKKKTPTEPVKAAARKTAPKAPGTPGKPKAPVRSRKPATPVVPAPVEVVARKRAATVKPKPKARVKAKAAPVPKAVPITVDEDAPTGEADNLCGLTVREAKFIDIYLTTFVIGQSYIEAGFQAKSGPSAQACGSRLLSSAKSRAYLARQTKAMFSRLEEEQDTLMRVFTYTAYADPRELVEYLRGACRHCYGKMHRYQFTAGEWDKVMTTYDDALEKAAQEGLDARKPRAPDPKGGVGYDWRKPPHEDCAECAGLGEGRTILKDTRNLSPAALALYAGVKEGKDGIEVKMHDQVKARETLAKIRKMYEDATSVNVTVDAEKLAAAYDNTMQKAHDKMAAMREERRKLREEQGGS